MDVMVLTESLDHLERRAAVVEQECLVTLVSLGRRACLDPPAHLVMTGSLELTERMELMGHPATEAIL